MGVVKRTHPWVVLRSKLDRSINRRIQRVLPTLADRKRADEAVDRFFAKILHGTGDREPRGIMGGDTDG